MFTGRIGCAQEKMKMKFCPHALPLFLIVCGIQQITAAASNATISIELGSSRVVTNEIDRITFSELNGTSITGNLSADFTFRGNEFVRLFSQSYVTNRYGFSTVIGTTPSFAVELTLQTGAPWSVGFLQGTGYLMDQRGESIPGFGVTGSSASDQGEMSLAFFPLFRDANGIPNTELRRPLDFYGVHFELSFPNLPFLEVTGGSFRLIDSDYEAVFGIGPEIPLDVPESSVFQLVGVGAAALTLARKRR